MKLKNVFYSVKPEIFFAVLILISGIATVFMVPVGGGFDEDTHLARIWEMSSGTLLPNQKLEINGFPPIFKELSYRQNPTYDSVGGDFWANNFGERIDRDLMIAHQTRSIYFPILYMVQAFIIGLFGRILNTPVLLIILLIRLSYLVLYILFTAIAIKVIPFGKWVLTLLALSPMAIMQASIISPDAITHGMSFLFIAWMLKLSIQREDIFTRREIIVMFLMIAMLFTLKINSSALILSFFLIPRSKFGTKRSYIFIVLWIILLFVVIVLGWSLLTSSELSTSGNNADVVLKQVKFIIQHPVEYSRIIIHELSESFGKYFKEWVGVFGYWYWEMPSLVYILYLGLLVMTMASESSGQNIGKKERIILASTFMAGYVLTVTLLYLKDNEVGAQFIGGVQGRYFIPMMLPLLLAVSIKKHLSEKFFKRIFFPGVILMILVFGTGMYLSYHVNCGTNTYTSGYCYKPNYKNWDSSPPFSEEIISSITLEQEIYVRCNNMEELRVWMKGSDSGSTSTSVVLSEVSSGRIILESRIENESVPKNGWMTLNFPVEMDSENHGYKIVLRSADAGIGNAAVVGVSTRNEYWDGEFLINGVPQDYDILFQYGCDAGNLGN